MSDDSDAMSLDAVDRAVEANRQFRPVDIDDDVVRRPMTAATETVHALLRHLRASGVEGVPDRRHRVEVFLEAYGDLPAFDLVDAVAGRMRATRDLMAARAAAGVEPQRTWVADGAAEREDDEIRWVEEHRHLVD
ncbi:MAG TPA: hypothetical protein VH085_00790 [Nocardioides sp.]|nr:hypothetical protein [Nocardioides sp.]